MTTLTSEMLAKMTLEERRKIAAHMLSPARCGGLDYVDGKPMYRAGGRLMTPEEFHRPRYGG